nr:cytochrome c oxidase subunit 2 [Tanacetum cinerariifolium]
MLEVDNRVILPELTHVRFIISSGDVIHSYACPALVSVIDAISELAINTKKIGKCYHDRVALERLLAINQLNNAYIVVEKADQITLRK